MKKLLYLLIVTCNPVFADSLSPEFLEGKWCEYGVSLKPNVERDESTPAEWVFNLDGTMKYNNGSLNYKVENNTIVSSSSFIGEWSLYEIKEDHMILKGRYGYAYYKRGDCILSKEAKLKKDTIIFQNAILLGNVEVVKEYLHNGIDPNIKNTETSSESTALHVAVNSGRLDIVKLLLENGADVNVTNYFDETPLSLAKKKKYSKIIEFLIENGAR